MTGIRLRYKKRRRELGEYWLARYAGAEGPALVELLWQDKFISRKLDRSQLVARWTKRNTIELWYHHQRLPGQIGFDRKIGD